MTDLAAAQPSQVGRLDDMNGAMESDGLEVKRGRGQSVGAKTFAQQQRSLHGPIGRIETSSDATVTASPISPPLLSQRSFIRQPPKSQGHSRHPSSSTQDSGFSSGVIRSSPSLRSLDSTLSPPSMNLAQLSPNPSPPLAPLPVPGPSRKEQSISPQPPHPSSLKRPNTERRPSRPRNDASGRSPTSSGDTVADFALEHLFASFMRDADSKINELSSPVAKSRISDHIENVCGPGADANFDKLLVAMGHVAYKQPEKLVDKVIGWKVFHDNSNVPSAPTSTASAINGGNPNAEASSAGADGRVSARPEQSLPPLQMSRPDEAMGDRRSSIATYLMCRALSDLLKQTTLKNLTSMTAVRLEGTLFDCSVTVITHDDMKRSALQRAKWEQATDVLGVMSRLDFGGVHGHYHKTLQECQELIAKGNAGPETIGRACTMLRGMRKLLPLGAEMTDFIQSTRCMGDLINLFGSAHGEEVKTQYCRTFEMLLLRLAQSISVEIVEDRKWRENAAVLQDRLHKLASKPKYRDAAFPALVALTCVAPSHMFMARWQSLPSSMATRLREQRHRGALLKGTCRLVWTALRRKDVLGKSGMAVLDEVVKVIFFSRKYALSRESYITAPLIQLIRTIAQDRPEYAFRNIIFPLVHVDLFNNAPPRGLSYQNLDPDKIILGIHAFLTVMLDVELSQAVAFPVSFDDDSEVLAELAASPLSPSASSFRHRPRKASLVKGDRLSHPVPVHQLSRPLQDSYDKFCELLSKILSVCDTAFGGQKSVDDMFAPAGGNRAPALLDAWSFARRDDEQNQAERTGKFGYLDLLHVAVQAIPRCLSSHTPINSVVDLLCTGTAHTEKNIAASSAISLKSIARQGYAEVITERFSFFIFRYDKEYSTTADGGLLGPSHIQSTLRLWIELLNLWEEELISKAKQRAMQDPRLIAPKSQNHVDLIEAQGLFLLCSPSSFVRSCAVDILNIVTRLDEALGATNPRIYGVLTGAVASAFPPRLDGRDNEFSGIEKAKLEKVSKLGSVDNAFVKLSGSSSPEDVAVWYKIFPNFVQVSHQVCPISVVQTRDDICSRLAKIQAQIDAPAEERSRAPTLGSSDGNTMRTASRAHVGPSRALIEQYKLYLIFACSTIQKQDGSTHTSPKDGNHIRQSSRSSAGSQDSFDSAQNLFSKIIPMLYHENADLRQAAVAGLSAINPTLYQLLLQSLDMQSRSLPPDIRNQYTHSRAASSPRMNASHPIYRQELLRIYERTSHILLDNKLYQEEWIMRHLSEFTWSLYEYLRQDDVYSETSSLRRYYCGLIQNFYVATLRCSDVRKWMSFAKRKAHFIKIEEWFNDAAPRDERGQSGGPHSPRGRLGNPHSDRDSLLENERLRTATSSAMATLCAGPFQATRPEPDEQFSVSRLLGFTEKLLTLEGDKMQKIGKDALINLISNNRQYPTIVEAILAKLFSSKKRPTTETYLDVLLEIFGQPNPPHVHEWRLISALLSTLGHTESSVRMKSARLLRIFEDANGCGSNLRNHEIGISDRTPAVNRQAHFDISNELLLHHQDSYFASCLFSQYAEYFVHLSSDSQRMMILVLLPWMRVIRLEKDRQTGYAPGTYVVLLNLIHMTVRCSYKLQNEIQALWQALLLNPLPGNARCVLDFVIDLSLQRRDPKYLRTAKQIVVYLASASTESAAGVIDNLLQNVQPRFMSSTEPSTPIQKPESTAQDYPHVVDWVTLFPEPVQNHRLSMGQLSLILLVDLVVKDASIAIDKLPELLQLVLVLWDHHSSIVQEQAREMLVHLVHVFVISKADVALVSQRKPSIEELVELIRRQDSKVGWAYNDSSDPSGPDALPPAMVYVISEALDLFSLTIPGIREKLGAMALNWAIQCPVRHVACRSLQVYRLILQPLGQEQLSEILNRTSSSISDQSPEHQAYSVDILRTIHAIVRTQKPESVLLPRVFWTTCAALESVHEWEYSEALSTFSDILEKCDLLNDRTVATLMANRPQDWDCNILTSFMPSLYRGCSSRVNHAKSLDLITRVMRIGCDRRFQDESCLRIGILANLPRLLHSYDDPVETTLCTAKALALRDCCDMMNERALSSVFNEFATAKPPQTVFFSTCTAAMQQSLFRTLDYDCAEFLMRQLLNPNPWMRRGTLQVAQALLPYINCDDARVKAQGLDLFSPLIKLLRTDFSQEALNVVDEVLPVVGVSNDLQHLKTANENHNALPPNFKPQPDVGSLYGVTTDTGWAFLDPATYNKRPRSMISAVAKFQVAQVDATFQPTTLTPEVEFQKEETFQDSYFPGITRSETATYDLVTQGPSDFNTFTNVPAETFLFNANITQLTAQLDDLDDFFEDDASETAVESETNALPTPRPLRRDPPRPLHQSKPSIVRPSTPMSHRKLESTTSFAGEVPGVSVNASPALPLQPSSQSNLPPMSPSAFAYPLSSDPQPPPARPGLTRAVTMPVSNLQTTPPDKAILKPFVETDPLSDDDIAGGRSRSGSERADSGTASRNNTPQKSFSTLRNSIKRKLTSDRHRRTNTRALPGVSPQVPPVPSEYLPPPHSDAL